MQAGGAEIGAARAIAHVARHQHRSRGRRRHDPGRQVHRGTEEVAAQRRDATPGKPDANGEVPLQGRGEPQAEKPPPSTLHSKVEPDSVDEKPKVGVESLVAPFGPAVMFVSGGVVSTTFPVGEKAVRKERVAEPPAGRSKVRRRSIGVPATTTDQG